MEGFGSSECATYNYGSVEDGYVQNPTLEQKLRKQYWKTKQTVRSKLKKSEDEHVVASDADIDIKLEKARHLQTSCHSLLHSLSRCSYHTQALSNNETILSDYLISNGDQDFTHAGEVMKKVGKGHDFNAKQRLRTIEPLFRLQQEFATFSNTAIIDLGDSIKRLEKSRTEYRAALLWMKNVSEKFNDPDASQQLAKFREAQATVKETKSYYDKMKINLMEKINMVSASRCNLLSHTLPYYQTELLNYLDQSANELHKLLVILRSQSQHQYRLNNLLEEIRELEVDETAPDNNNVTTSEASSIQNNNKNDPLFGLLQQELYAVAQSQEDDMSDFISSEPPTMPSTESRDLLTEEWDQYSALEATKDQPLSEDIEPVNDDTNWTDDLVLAEQTTPNELNLEIEKLLALDKVKKSPPPIITKDDDNDNTFDPLLLNTSIVSTSESSINTTVMSTTFATGNTLPTTESPLPTTESPLPTTGSLLPTTGSPLPITGSPLSITGSSIPSTESPLSMTGSSLPISKVGRGSSGYKPMLSQYKCKDEEAGANNKWDNLFADLDPIANEKA